ncbi:ribonucleotide-diphosphate reductase subunit beta [Candidatus Poribacteria bacterium]|nr:ribonucleotide-diphosphate reductase subunit beta [Candidatus Poribacteria bacterium]
MLDPSDDRRALDTIIFDTLGLTQDERDAVYEAVVNLVEARLRKARSLKAK